MKGQEANGKQEEANMVEDYESDVYTIMEDDPKEDGNNSKWVMDSLTSMYICNDSTFFVNMMRHDLGKVTMVISEKVNIEGIGDV
ncbi:hypothetical protein SLEP1_g54898 [Rubroshorea leprosula]|uniref:Uncharacterized protein n=1 Tax=Rubroshorea leprosula TaxID=152421 RepID=A0AAV5MGS5_9ROSI|nr:hypothetical protein SLEP1_g54898 [Rubroshorea leprosula]